MMVGEGNSPVNQSVVGLAIHTVVLFALNPTVLTTLPQSSQDSYVRHPSAQLDFLATGQPSFPPADILP